MTISIKDIQVAVDKVLNKPTKYLSAKQAEQEFGINAKTLLNRSNLPVRSKRFIPTVRLKGGRKKYFERKVLERLIEPVPPEVY